MALPDTVRVKLSPEVAGPIALTRVVARDMPVRELVELMLDFTGKDAARVCELLRRGTLVSGASRFRWAGWDAGLADVDALLATLPGPEPSRAFTFNACLRVSLRSAGRRIEIPREAGSRRRFLRRTTFWDAVAEAAGAGVPRYTGYSYRERADIYELALSREAATRLRAGAARLNYSGLETQVRAAALEAIEFVVARLD